MARSKGRVFPLKYGLFESPKKQPRYAREARAMWGELLAAIEGTGMSTMDISRHTGIWPTGLSELLNGKRATVFGPQLFTVIALADACGLVLRLVDKKTGRSRGNFRGKK